MAARLAVAECPEPRCPAHRRSMAGIPRPTLRSAATRTRPHCLRTAPPLHLQRPPHLRRPPSPPRPRLCPPRILPAKSELSHGGSTLPRFSRRLRPCVLVFSCLSSVRTGNRESTRLNSCYIS